MREVARRRVESLSPDEEGAVHGTCVVRVLDREGDEVRRQSLQVSIPAYWKQYVPTGLWLPHKGGGYILLAEFTPSQSKNASPLISRRYIKVGEMDKHVFYEYKPEPLKY